MNRMKRARMLKLFGMAMCVGAVAVPAQNPGDTVNSLSIGGRGFGMGGAFAAIADDVTAAAWNPAGLAYLTRPEFQVVMRTMPSYDTIQSGNAINPTERTSGSAGAQQAGFVGLAVPLKNSRLGGNGTLGLAYWRGGFYEESVFAARLTSGDPDSNLEIRPREQNTRLVTDFFTLSYGFKAGGDMNIGIGVVYAQQKLDYSLSETIVDPANPNDPLGVTENQLNETGTGVGGQIGVMAPFGGGKGTWGLTYRSEISLQNYGAGDTFADKIPARFSASASYLLAEVSRGSYQDFLVGAAQIDHYTKANTGLSDARAETTNFGLGLQYMMSMRGFSLPIRIGFMTNKAANGVRFADEDLFTFGLGFRPNRGNWNLDLDFASSSKRSGMDFSLSFAYQFGEE